jgi:hypothetical protein
MSIEMCQHHLKALVKAILPQSACIQALSFATSIGDFTKGQLQFPAKFFPIRQLELIFLDKELTVHLVRSILHEQFIFVASKNNAYDATHSIGQKASDLSDSCGKEASCK